jgi:hypothetical protein
MTKPKSLSLRALLYEYKRPEYGEEMARRLAALDTWLWDAQRARGEWVSTHEVRDRLNGQEEKWQSR